MNNHWRGLGILLLLLGGLARLSATDFCLNSAISQLVGEVQEQKANAAPRPAKLADPIGVGDYLKTGSASRAELTSGDSTVIRIGANSIFSFSEKSRQLILNQGSLLFHTPHGEGGGLIQTAAVTAAVTGSTVAVSTTQSGGVKIVPLESACRVTGANGRLIASLVPGQLLALIPGNAPAIFRIDLGAFTRTSGLIHQFDTPLSKEVQGKIQENVTKQAPEIASQTGVLLVDDFALPPPSVRPPLEVLAPILVQDTSPQRVIIIAPDLAARFQTNLSPVDQLFPTTFSQNIFTLKNADLFRSPLAYIQQVVDPPTPAVYPPSAALSDRTLATLGITPALPGGYSLPSTAQGLVGNNIALSGTTDANTTDLQGYRAAGYFGVIALGNLTFTPTSLSNSGLTFVNSPNTLAFSAAGSITLDGSAVSNLPSNTHVGILTDAANLFIGSVGDFNSNQIFLSAGDENTGTGNVYLGTLGNANLLNTRINAGANANIYARGDLNMTVTSHESGCPFYFPGIFAYGGNSVCGNINLTAGGDINLIGNGPYQVVLSLPTAGSYSAGSISLNSGRDITLAGSLLIFAHGLGGSAITINALRDLRISGESIFDVSAGTSLTLTAGRLLDVNEATNTDIGNAAMTYRLSAPTINLSNITFPSGSTIYLSSTNGMANFGSSLTDYVNFITGVNYGSPSNPISSPSQLAGNPNFFLSRR